MLDLCAQLRRWFLPHLVAGVGIFLWMSYVTASVLFASWPWGLKWLGIWAAFVGYGVAAFGYSFFTACVFSLRLACIGWNDLINDILELVEQQTEQRLTQFNTAISKPQAKALVRGSVADVFAVLKQENRSAPRLVVWAGLGLLALAVRAVLAAKIAKWAGRTVQLTKLFAGRATLVGAVFLNLHFLATVLLFLCYSAGLMVLAVNIYFVFLLK